MSEINIELVTKEVLETSKKAQDKRLTFFNDIFSKVRKGNKESVDALRVIEKNYQAELLVEKESFNNLKTKVEELENELKVALDNFNQNFNVEVETEKLKENKEKGLLPKTQIYRKETHDVTFKLDRLTKEEKETLKTKQDEFDELENSYKGKISDLEKRLRFEVNKIKNHTLSQYDELQKSLLNTNNRREIKQINKKIEEIRKVGIKSEKEIRLQYLKEIQAVEIEFAKVRSEALVNINNIKKDFNIKKQELDCDKKIVNLNYQIESDKYDFGSRRAINNLKQKMLAKKHSVIISQYENIKNISLDYQKEQREKINYKKSISNDFVNVMTNNYNAFDETLKLGTLLVNNSYVEQIEAFNVYLNTVFDHALDLFILLHDEYVNNVINSEYETIKLFINAKYNYESLCKRDFKADLDRVNELYNKFTEGMKNNALVYNEKVKALFENLKVNLESLIKDLKNIWNETNLIDSYHNDIQNELKLIVSKTCEYLNKSYEDENNSFNYVDEQVKKYDDAVDLANNENKAMEEEHKNTENVINDDINKYHQEQENVRDSYKTELKENIELIEKETDEVNNSYVEEMKQTLVNIDNKKLNDTKEIEEDYKTQMNLLK